MKWKSPDRGERVRPPIPSLLSRYPSRRAAADRERVLELLNLVQIPRPEEAFRKLPHEFSGGQRQRLMIAMALLSEPRLIIADEPTTALDVTIQAQILSLLRRLVKERGISVLFTTHDLGTAWELCDKVTVMYAGQEMESAPAGSVLRPAAHPYTARLLESLPGRDALSPGLEARFRSWSIRRVAAASIPGAGSRPRNAGSPVPRCAPSSPAHGPVPSSDFPVPGMTVPPFSRSAHSGATSPSATCRGCAPDGSRPSTT